MDKMTLEQMTRSELSPLFTKERLDGIRSGYMEDPKDITGAFGARRPEQLFVKGLGCSDTIQYILERWFSTLNFEGHDWGIENPWLSETYAYEVIRRWQGGPRGGSGYIFAGYMIETSGSIWPSSRLYFPMAENERDWLLSAEVKPEDTRRFSRPREVGLICRFTGLELEEE